MILLLLRTRQVAGNISAHRTIPLKSNDKMNNYNIILILRQHLQ